MKGIIMKSDWDDAPDYRRNNKKHSPWRMVISLGIGSAITWGLIALFAKPIIIDVNQLKQAIRIGGKPLFSEQQAQPPAYSELAAPIRLPSLSLEPAQPQLPASKAEIEWGERMQGDEAERAKNSFNDNNYRPKQLANTYAPPATQIASAPTVSERKQRQVSKEKTAIWIKSWNGGTRYLAEWVSVNNYIDGGSVCVNHRKGSIDYRECRKAAKQHYHEECRAWRARYDNDRQDHSERMRQRYCSASSSFSPMG